MVNISSGGTRVNSNQTPAAPPPQVGSTVSTTPTGATDAAATAAPPETPAAVAAEPAEAAPSATPETAAEATAQHKHNLAASGLRRALEARLPQPVAAAAPPPGANAFVPAPAPGMAMPPPPPPPAPPTPATPNPPAGDTAASAVKQMSADGRIDAQEAKKVVELAKADASLPPGENDEKKVVPALINTYVRSGLPVHEAQRSAQETYKLANNPGGNPVSVHNSHGPKLDGNKLRAELESSVKNNADAAKPWTAEQIKNDRTGFVRNLSQMDGDVTSSKDRTACTTSSMLGGMILQDPAKAQEMAGRLNSPAGQKQFPNMQQPPVKASLDAMAKGTYSARDASNVANGLAENQRSGPADDAGLGLGKQMAIVGKLKGLGVDVPPMEQRTFAATNGDGKHVTALANGTGFDPWPYPGSNGQSVLVKGGDALDQHGKSIGPRLGITTQHREEFSRMTHDGKGGLTMERNFIDNQKLDPPIKATYALKNGEWTRTSPASLPAGQEKYMPARVSLDANKRTGFED